MLDGSGTAWALAPLLLIACGTPAPDPTSAEPPRADLEGAWVGCVDRTAANTCVFDPEQPLTLWVASDPRSEPHLLVNGVELSVDATTLRHGRRWSLQPDATWRVVLVSSKTGSATFRLTPAPPVAKALAAADAHRRDGRLDEARAALDATWQTLTKSERVDGLELRGDIAFMRGDIARAREAYVEGATLASNAG